jgi:hypothetical protein
VTGETWFTRQVDKAQASVRQWPEWMQRQAGLLPESGGAMKGEIEQELLAGVLPVLRAQASDGMVFLAYVSRQWDGYDRARFATAQAALTRSRALYEFARPDICACGDHITPGVGVCEVCAMDAPAGEWSPRPFALEESE